MANHRATPTVPSWWAVHPDPAANRDNYRAVRFVAAFVLVWTPLVGLAHSTGGDPASVDPASVSAPLAPCGGDASCAAWDAYVAQDVYGVPVWAGDPARTPHAEDRGHGRGVLRLSCPQGGALHDTAEGVSC
jgi:hypothetical protein